MPRQQGRLFATRCNRVGDRYRLEPERSSRPRLGQPAEIGTNDGGNLRITAGRLTIGHQNDRTAVSRHLDRTHGDPVGDDVVAACVRQSGSVEKIRHAIAFGGDGPRPSQKCSDLVVGKVVVLRTKDHTNGVEGPVEPGRNDGARRRLRRSGPFDAQTIARDDSAAVHAAEAGARVGGVRAEHLWHDEATRHRQVAPGAAAPGANFQHGAFIQIENHRGRQRPAVEAEREFAAGDGDTERSGFGGHFNTTQGNLQRRRTRGIADSKVCRGMRQRIHRARGGDAKPQIAVTTGILQRRALPG